MDPSTPGGDPVSARLAQAGPAGVFLRFVLARTGRQDLFDVLPGGLVGSGLPAGVFVASSHWLLADDEATAERLAAPVLAEPRARALYRLAPGAPSVPAGWRLGTDLLFEGEGVRAESARVVHGEAFLSALDRLEPELERHVPPPAILDRLPFRFHGLLHEGRIVALCDTTVDDGEWAAIQQVHTAKALQRRGLARALTQGVLAFLGDLGRRAVWVCDADNVPSRRTAEACGLPLVRELPLLSRV